MGRALLGVFLAASPLDSISSEQEALFEGIAPTVVFVSTRAGFGSGFFVARNGLILTNAHVVGDAKTVSVILHDGRKFQGEVVERGGEGIDLALVKVPLENVETVSLGTASPRVGQWVGAVGHGSGAIWTFSSGMVSNVYPEGAERPVFQTQIPLNPGNSGGPIFDARGTVIGVVTAALKEATAINFGISIATARKALAGLSVTCECVRITAPAGVPVFLDGALAGSGPVVVSDVKAGRHEAFVVQKSTMTKRAFEFPAQRQVDLSGP